MRAHLSTLTRICNMGDEVKEIILQRSERFGFGFSIIGGSGSELPPVVCDIVENSPADHCQSLHAGDVILAVNGEPVANYTTKEVLKCLRLSGDRLAVVLRQDSEARSRVEHYLSCDPSDINSLRDVISQKDLTGVEEIIVKCSGSPRLGPRRPQRSVSDDSSIDSDAHSPEKMPKRTELSGMATASHFQENGFIDQPSPSKRQDRGFETFVMTGDMIIRTTSSQSGSEIKKTSIEKKSKNAKNSEGHHSGVTKKPPAPDSPRTKADGRPSRIPTPGSQVKGSPKHKVSRLPRPNRTEPSPSQVRKNSTDSDTSSVDINPPSQIENLESVNNNLVTDVIVSESPVLVSSQPVLTFKETEEVKADNKHPPLVRDPSLDDTPVYLQKPHLLNANPVFIGMTAGGSPELDIPPDDISSEDDKYIGMDTLVDLDDLPPPPDELLTDYPEKPSEVAKTEVPIKQKEMSPSRIPFFNARPSPILSTPPSCEPELSSPSPPPPPILESPILPDPPPPILESPVQPAPALIATVTPDLQSDPWQESRIPQRSVKVTPSSPARSRTTRIPVKGLSGIPSPQPTILKDKSVSVTTQESSESSEEFVESTNNSVTTTKVTSSTKKIVVSKSEEKIISKQMKIRTETSGQTTGFIRASKSQEEHMEHNNMSTVGIDLDDDMTTSLDVLHYANQSSVTSIEQVGQSPQTRSLDSSPSPERRAKKLHMPTFISLDEPRSTSRGRAHGEDLSDHSIEEEVLREPRLVPGKSDQELAVEEDAVIHENLEAVLEAAGGRANDKEDARLRGSIVESPKVKNAPETLPILPAPVPSKQTNNSNSSSPERRKSPAKSPAKSPGRRGSGGASPRYKPGVKLDIGRKAGSPSHSPAHSPTSSHPSATGSDGFQEVVEEEAPPEVRSCPSSPETGHDSDSDSVYHQPIKDIDRPSAQRLAKRLFQSEGFKKTDICRHLCKKNDFAKLVGEEYLKYFDFTGQTLDAALRSFLKRLALTGETQERERVLAHFSHRYMETNPKCFNSEDACHTLVCAMMLLNTDLHGQNIGRRMTLAEFIENLADLNDGQNFPKEVLSHIYQSIKAEPIEFEFDDEMDELTIEVGPGQRPQITEPRFLGHNPFLNLPDASKSKEYKKGFVMRKCCIDPDGRRTPMGKRGWKMFYAVLRDMVLFMYKDEHAAKKSLHDNMNNAVRIHHALAIKATDYTKKEHVFRLQTADWAQYLLQTGDSKECQDWVDTLNFAASSLSAPPLPGAVGSQRKFQRPLMPSSKTKLSMAQQLTHHEQKVLQLEQELQEHCSYPPEKGAKSRVIADYLEKENFLQYELKRFKTYTFLLQSKMSSYPDLEPSLVEVAIGEVDEPPSPTSGSKAHPLAKGPRQQETETTGAQPKPQKTSRPVQRSMSDRNELDAEAYSQFMRRYPLFGTASEHGTAV